MSAELLNLPLSSIITSSTKAQAERRAHFSEAAISELAESIKAVGLLSPLVARPAGVEDSRGPLYELVAGERRFLAAERAGLTQVPVSVRDLTDQQVLEVQLVENLQREDLHELAEAEGYEQLQQLGHSVEDIAAKVGKSKATVYARCKLLALGPEGREALRSGDLSASIALLIARISPALQAGAVKKVLNPYANAPAMTYRDASHYLHREYTFRLDEARFDTEDERLVPAAGACTSCPKRSGNQPELFSDIQRGDVCTDVQCFKSKRQAHTDQAVLAARAAGKEVLELDEAEGYVELDQKCYDDGKGRTYRQLLGDGVKSAMLLDSDSGEITEAVRKSDFAKQLKKACAPHERPKPYEPPARKIDPKAERQKKLDQRIYRAIFDASPTALREAAEFAAADGMQAFGYMQDICEALGWDEFDMDEPRKQVAKLSNADLARLLQVIPLCEEMHGYGSTSSRLLEAAKAVKVNVKLIEQQLDAELAPKASPPAAKKKAAKKAPRKPK